MRDLFAPVAPKPRDTSADDARARAAKAAHAPIFGAAPSPVQTLARKAAQLAAEAEAETVRRITARPVQPTLAQRRDALPRHIAAKTDGPLGLSVAAAELLARICARYAVEQAPVVLSTSTLAAATGCTEEEAARQVAELQARNLILAVTDALGRRGFRPEPSLTR